MLCFLRSGQPVTKLEFGQFEDLQKVSKENNSKNFMTTRRNVLLHHLQKQCVEQFWLFLGHFEAIASEIAAFQCLECQTG